MNVAHHLCDLHSRSLAFLTVLLVTGCLLASPGSAAADAGPSASIIRATPYYVSAKQRGYRLYPISDPAPYEALGLQPGDLLLEVDGQPMIEPHAHLRLFELLDSGSLVGVKLRRNDEVVELTLRLE